MDSSRTLAQIETERSKYSIECFPFQTITTRQHYFYALNILHKWNFKLSQLKWNSFKQFWNPKAKHIDTWNVYILPKHHHQHFQSLSNLYPRRRCECTLIELVTYSTFSSMTHSLNGLRTKQSISIQTLNIIPPFFHSTPFHIRIRTRTHVATPPFYYHIGIKVWNLFAIFILFSFFFVRRRSSLYMQPLYTVVNSRAIETAESKTFQAT